MARHDNEEGRPGQGAPFRNHHDTDGEHSTETDNGPGPLFERPSAPVAELAGEATVDEFDDQFRIALSMLIVGPCTNDDFYKRGIGHGASRIADIRKRFGQDFITTSMVTREKANGKKCRIALYRIAGQVDVSGVLEAKAS